MCSRFELNVAPADLLARFGLTAPPDEDAATRAALDGLPKAEIRPTDRVPVIGPRRVPIALPWGFAVDWDTKPLINARAETLTEKPTFRPVLGNRCLVPLSAFYEWTPVPGAPARARKRRHRIGRADAPVHAMAGLVDDRGRFTVITRPATEQMAALHHRMPAFLTDAEAEAAWLDPDRPFEAVRGLLTAWDGALAIDDDEPGGEGRAAPGSQESMF
ncbi:SOS response-associated peptidase [Roseospira navarrensis]|uniref:Abasic site processing protein n=1 Tax=Roseospira navarrensis TaxID=140058 RepID=A0A7X1ZCS0_9PROT|nr:SOS response-associated peptidase family protein [Roseospira navarrensis]MQX35146.1 SOS response-associated peptidase [Roseospira navarrensis]